MAIKTKHKKNPGLKEALIGVFEALEGISPQKKQRILTSLKSPSIHIPSTKESKMHISHLFALCYAGENMNPSDQSLLTNFLAEKKPKVTDTEASRVGLKR